MTVSDREPLNPDHDKRSAEIEACPYCSSPAQHLVSSPDLNRQTTQSTFNYYQCTNCGLVFLYPQPDDMTAAYQGGYQSIPKDLSRLRKIAETERYRLDAILRYKTEGRLLEIGPWMGIFSCNAKDAGFDVTAIEMDQDCVAFLRHVVKIEAIQSSNPAATLNELQVKFDVIVMWHSLEHLPEPWLVLQQAAEKLAPGGILVIAVPNIESHEFSLMGADWFHLDAPRHLYFYPVRWLEAYGMSNGLRVLESTTSDRLSQMLSRDAWYKRASSRVPVLYLRGILARLLYKRARDRFKADYLGSGLTAILTRST